MLICHRSIVQSRKRKLRELFAVATDETAIPNHDFSDPDAPPTTPAEAKFLSECDILQYVCSPKLSWCLASLRHLVAPSLQPVLFLFLYYFL